MNRFPNEPLRPGRGPGRGPGRPLSAAELAELGALFERSLPELLRYLPLAQRGAYCQADRDDRLAGLLYYAWRSFLRLASTDRPIGSALRQIGRYAALASLSRSGLTTRPGLKDAMNGARRKVGGRALVRESELVHRAAMEWARGEDNGRDEALLVSFTLDRKGMPPWQRAAWREVLRTVFRTFGKRDRAILRALALGFTNTAVGRMFGVGHSRVCQIRKEALRRFEEM